MVIIAYLLQERIDVAEEFLGRKLTWEEKDRMYSLVRTADVVQANRLVEHFRMTGHIAFIKGEE